MPNVSGSKWGSSTLGTTGGVVTWSIAAAGTDLGPFYTGGDSSSRYSVDAATAHPFDVEAVLRDAFDAWAAVSEIEFIQVEDGGGAAGTGRDGTIRVFLTPIPGSGAGVAYYPSRSAIGGDMILDSLDSFSEGTFLALAMHELGHAIGLGHFSGDHIMNPSLNGRTTLSSDDISGAQQTYGPDSGDPAVYTMDGTDRDLTVLYGPPDLVVFGNGLDNRIETGGGDQTLWGVGGDDQIFGGDGADVIDGGTGADTLYGGLGDDHYYVDHAGDRIVEDSNQGRDIVFSDGSFSLRDHSQHLEELILQNPGDFYAIGNWQENTITGNAGDNLLNGAWSNDVLYGGAGNDTFRDDDGADRMYGGRGDDTYYVDHAGDRIFEEKQQGLDVVFSSVSFALRDHSQHLFELTLTGTDDITGIGNWQANTITGNAGDNLLNGAFANDVLYGGAGNDTFRDDDGADTMIGGAGNDTYFVDNVGDRIVEDPRQGHDVVFSSVSIALRDHSQHLFELTLTGTDDITGIGNWQENTITGNAGDNRLDGAWSQDLLIGGAGADIFEFSASLDAANADTIADFQSGEDLIGLDARVFTAYSQGAIAAGSLVNGAAAADAGDRLIFDGGSSALLYDPDGTGAAAAVQIATLSGVTGLSESDFIVL